MTFWTYIWWFFEAFIGIACLFLVILILIDVFRDRALAVGWKVLWVVVLVFFPLLAALVYVIVRGRGMAERYAVHERRAPEEDGYRPAASSDPDADIARAQDLLDKGVISQGEFEALKSKALGRQYFG
jgi:Na+/melibiose symporter-like transporter